MAKSPQAGAVGAALGPTMEIKVQRPANPQDQQKFGIPPTQPGAPPVMITETQKVESPAMPPMQGGGPGAQMPPPPAGQSAAMPPMPAMQNPQGGGPDEMLMRLLTGKF